MHGLVFPVLLRCMLVCSTNIILLIRYVAFSYILICYRGTLDMKLSQLLFYQHSCRIEVNMELGWYISMLFFCLVKFSFIDLYIVIYSTMFYCYSIPYWRLAQLYFLLYNRFTAIKSIKSYH